MNSMGDKKEGMMYICGKCAHEVERDAKVCPFCHANLNNIRCPYCGFVGAPEKFRNDKCPRCGKSKNISIDYSSASFQRKHSAKDEIQIKTDEAHSAQKSSLFSELLNRFFVPLILILASLALVFGYLLLN